MANRSDINSKLPRQFKRMISLAPDGVANGRIVRKLFIEAHTSFMVARKNILSGKMNTDKEEQTEQVTLVV